MKKKRHIFSIFFISIVMYMLSSVIVGANDTHHHSVRNGGEELFWTGISEANEIIGNGNYYLKEDITLTADLVIDEMVSLCLNGHKLDVSELGGIKQVKISENGTLNICDCSGTDSGMITSSRDTSTIFNNGKLNLYSGSLNRYVDDTTCIVKNETNAEMNMYGGKIYGTTIGVKTKGFFNIYGGSITGARGAFQIEGGKTIITQNADVDCSGEDWATISLYGGELNISGGTVKNSGGSTVIQLLYGESRLNISDGRISASGKTNCIYTASADAEINISGGTIECTYGSVNYDNTHGNRYGWGINAVSFSTLNLSGTPSVDNIYLYDTNSITIPTSGLQNKNPIGIFCRCYPLAFIDGNSTDYSSNFVCKAPNSAYILYNTNENKLVFAMKTAIGGKISIIGKSNIKEILTAVYTPSDENETYVYQWYCDDVAIEGEANSTYTVRPEDINKRIKVVVSGTGFYRETKYAETTIVKTAVQYTPPTANRFEFSGTEQELVQTGECQGGVMKYSLSETGEFSAEIPKATNVGRYVVYYRAFGDAYHSDGAIGSVMARIMAKDIADAEVVLGDKLVYTGNEQTQSIASVKIGEIDVTYDVVSGEKATIYTPQGYVLTIKGNGNFTGTKEISYVIEKATPIQNPEKLTTARVRRGQTLANATITNGDFFAVDGTTVLEGTFAWVDDTKEITADSTEKMKFTPTDTNYAEIEIDVAVDSYTTDGGGGSSNTTTTTTKNDDGSTTKTTTNKTTGTTTEVTTNTDGSTTTVETKKDGTVTTTEKDKDGNTTTTVENPDGSSTTTEKNKDGSETVVEKDTEGTTTTTKKDSKGNKTVTTEKADGSTTTEETKKDGTTVKTETTANGETTAEVEAKGETEVVIPVPDADEVTKVVVTDKDGNETEVEFEVKDGGIAISVSGNSTVSVQTGHTCYAKDFTDVDLNAWYHLNIDYVLESGLFKGTTDTTFTPNDNLTRAMLVTVLYRAEGAPATNRSIPFADVDMGSYYANAVIWAQQNGIVKGVSETEFAPNDNITREQIAAILYRYAIYKGMDAVNLSENLSFTDADDISEYAISALNWAVGTGLIKGYEDNTVRPLNNATRAETAALLQRFIEANK